MINTQLGKVKILAMTIVKAWFSRFLIVLAFCFGAIVLLALVATKANAMYYNDDPDSVVNWALSHSSEFPELNTWGDYYLCTYRNSYTVSGFRCDSYDFYLFDSQEIRFSNPDGLQLSPDVVQFKRYVIEIGFDNGEQFFNKTGTYGGVLLTNNPSDNLNYRFQGSIGYYYPNYNNNYGCATNARLYYGDVLIAGSSVVEPDYYYITCVNDQINFGCKVALTVGEELRSAKFSKPYLFALQYHHNNEELYYVCPNYFSSFTEYSVVDVNVDTWDCIMRGYQVQSGYGIDCKVLEYRDRIVQNDGNPVSIPTSPKLVTVTEENFDRWLDPREDYNVLYLYQITKAIQNDYPDFQDNELLTQNLTLVLIDYNDFQADGSLTPLVIKEINYQGLVDSIVPPPEGSPDLTDTDSPVYKPRSYDLENFDKLSHLESPDFDFTLPEFDPEPVNFFAWLWATLTSSPLGILIISCLSFIIAGIIIRGM